MKYVEHIYNLLTQYVIIRVVVVHKTHIYLDSGIVHSSMVFQVTTILCVNLSVVIFRTVGNNASFRRIGGPIDVFGNVHHVQGVLTLQLAVNRFVCQGVDVARRLDGILVHSKHAPGEEHRHA